MTRFRSSYLPSPYSFSIAALLLHGVDCWPFHQSITAFLNHTLATLRSTLPGQFIFALSIMSAHLGPTWCTSHNLLLVDADICAVESRGQRARHLNPFSHATSHGSSSTTVSSCLLRRFRAIRVSQRRSCGMRHALAGTCSHVYVRHGCSSLISAHHYDWTLSV